MSEEKAKYRPQIPPATLFPILSSPTGLAKLAAEAPQTGAGHHVEFHAMQVRGILNRSISKRRFWAVYSINPYRGCEFACRYCYARYTHEFLAPAPQPTPAALPSPTPAPSLSDPEAFERIIFLKQNAAWLFEQELKRIDPTQQIALGTATDPYQPIERTARITRSLLEVLARKQGYRLGIVTKSALIARDIDLLTQIARTNSLTVHLTITTADAALARKLEPRAPRPDLRFATVRKLREAGIATGILCSPLLPGITDSEKAIHGMARRAAAAGASFFAANPLFLKPCSRPTYFSFVREHFPELVADYETRFAGRDFATAAYSRRLAAIVAQACRRHGLPQRSRRELLVRGPAFPANPQTPPELHAQRKPPESAAPCSQQTLFA